MLKKKKTTASGKLVLVKSVRRTRSHRMKFCVQRGLGALPSTSKRRGKSQRDFLLCGPVCINTGIACLFSLEDEGVNQMKMLYSSCPPEMRDTLLHHTQETVKELTELSEKFEMN